MIAASVMAAPRVVVDRGGERRIASLSPGFCDTEDICDTETLNILCLGIMGRVIITGEEDTMAAAAVSKIGTDLDFETVRFSSLFHAYWVWFVHL